VTLLSPFSDPVALKLLGAARRRRSWTSVTPPPVPARGHRHAAVDAQCCAVGEMLAVALLGDPPPDEVVAELEESVDADVVTWTPSIHLRSRAALLDAVANADDAIAEVRVTPTVRIAEQDSIHLEWTISGIFRRAGFLNDDVLIEPSGGPIEAAGVLTATFDGDAVVQIRCYYDRLAILEQVLRPAVVP
jgi:hypothetical protein